MVTYRDEQALVADASNRALRTFLVGLAVDLAVAVAATILAGLDAVSDQASLIAFGISLGKTVITTGCSYVLRRFIDRSSIPTPLPPAVAGPPDSLAPAV